MTQPNEPATSDPATFNEPASQNSPDRNGMDSSRDDGNNDVHEQGMVPVKPNVPTDLSLTPNLGPFT